MRMRNHAVTWTTPQARERCLREAQRYTRCPVEAEDVVQEALLRAWKTRSKLRNSAQPMPWLLQITRNEALRHLARSSRERERAPLGAEREGHDGWADTAVIRLDVAAAMRQFEPDEQTLIHLRYAAELTHSNIADLMSIPIGTCKVRLHRLRKRLNALLAEEVPA